MSPGDLIKRRPTEAITGPAAASLAYTFMVDRGCDPLLALLVAVVIAFVPTGISEVVEYRRGPLVVEAELTTEDVDGELGSRVAKGS